MPGQIRFNGPDGQPVMRPLQNLSASGFAFDSETLSLQAGSRFDGELIFDMDGFRMGVDIRFEVIGTHASREGGKRIACQFHDLGRRQIAALRELSNAYLSGQLVSLSGMLRAWYSKDLTRPREDGGMGKGARLRAWLGTAVITILALPTFAFGVYHFGQLLLVTRAVSAAVVVSPSMQLSMPRDGWVRSLIGEDGAVAKGAAIASFSMSALDVLKGGEQGGDLKPEKIEQLYNTRLTNVLVSPCDCVLIRQLIADDQYASKDAVIFELLPRDGRVVIDARFPYSKLADAQAGSRVDIRISGEAKVRGGRIVSSTLLDGGALSSDLRVQIQPDVPLESDLAGRAVDVRLWLWRKWL
jgi:alginate biosynthesis protein Alg44